MNKKIGDTLNLIGASIRWLYGALFSQFPAAGSNLEFDEYLNGSENKEDTIGKIGHRKVNIIFALFLIATVISIIINLVSGNY